VQVKPEETIYCIMTHHGLPMFEVRDKGLVGKGRSESFSYHVV
jgi:hypothetical protein